jgi:hypothetical protein
VADEQGSQFISAARSVMVLFLGSTYSDAWAPTGFPNQSTAVPESMAERQSLLKSLHLYFADHPEREVPMLGVTSERAGILYTGFCGSRSAVNNAYAEIAASKVARDAAIAELRKTMRAFIDELSYLLTDDDPHWYRFGLVPPATSSTPEKVEAVELTNLGGGPVEIAWTGAPRAGRYRVLKQIVGVDAEPVPVATTYDTRFMLTGPAVGQRVKVQIIAANDVAESGPSEAVEILVT